MSIESVLRELIRTQKLIERPSSFTGYETARTMIVTPEIDAITKKPFADTCEGIRLGEFAAWLDAFSEGGEMSVSENCRQKSPDTMLARVCPPSAEFWIIRVTHPEDSAGIRSLGGFAGKDTFIALTWDKREKIPDFDEEVWAAREAWADYFGTDSPFRGRNIDAYLTNWT